MDGMTEIGRDEDILGPSVRGDADEGLAERGLTPEEKALHAERASLLEEIASLERRLERSEAANRSKDEFLATLSHELRTPLNAMLGWAQMLAKEELDPATFARAIQAIERNTKLQADLIDELLDVSRIISGKLRIEPSTVRLTPLIAAAVDGFRAQGAEKGIELDLHIDPVRDLVRGDATRLNQIIGNLLTNALKFTPVGGRVEVSVTAPAEGRVEVSVRDSGRGIKPDFLPHVFERFRQGDLSTTRANGGLGLGLAIVRHLTELHGGRIHAHSEGEGRGATFVFELPVCPTDQLPSAPRRPGSRSGSGLGRKRTGTLDGVSVIVVDDEPDARDLIAAMLSQLGAFVTTAASVSEALEHLRASVPDVLVSDIAMPVRDGYQLVRQLRALPSSAGGSTPAIALSGHASRADRDRALEAGFDRHLAKPVEVEQLVGLILELVGQAR